MIRVATTAAVFLIALSAAHAAGTNVEINAISAEGTGKSLGSVSLSESEGGVAMNVSVSGVADGEHGFHEKGDCGPGIKDGKIEAGLAAGSHYDPHATKSHKGPDGGGHEGDLPKLTAAGGKIEQTVKLNNIKLADIAGRSRLIHEGGDNYSDNPENGGGKGRIACGVIPK
jgi:Cu-Zn family superoxide dismutase